MEISTCKMAVVMFLDKLSFLQHKNVLALHKKSFQIWAKYVRQNLIPKPSMTNYVNIKCSLLHSQSIENQMN